MLRASSEEERLANDPSLAEAADVVHLHRFLLLSKGERKKSRIEESIRAGAYEAVVAAIFTEGGYDGGRQVRGPYDTDL